MSAQPHGPAELEAGAKFKQGRTTFEIIKVTPAMVLARSGRRGHETERWFWKKTLADVQVLS